MPLSQRLWHNMPFTQFCVNVFMENRAEEMLECWLAVVNEVAAQVFDSPLDFFGRLGTRSALQVSPLKRVSSQWSGHEINACLFLQRHDYVGLVLT